LWIARAINSLPVPVSPVIKTVESVGATLATTASTSCKAGDLPTISSNIDAPSDLFSKRDVLFIELILQLVDFE
jgi:hypothetical protein